VLTALKIERHDGFGYRRIADNDLSLYLGFVWFIGIFLDYGKHRYARQY